MDPVWEKMSGQRRVTYGLDEPKWFRVNLGDNENEMDGSKAAWCAEHISADDYRLRDVGFTYSDYVIDFRHESDVTLFLLRWGVNSG
jgi:hypothetical protein